MKRSIVIFAMLLPACAALQPPQQPVANTYVLDARPAAAPRQAAHERVLAVVMPRARPGFDTAQMAYLRRPHELEYFAKSRWADAPARMLAPLVAQAIERAGGVREVALSPGAALADLRLDAELVRLLQDFTAAPSRARITLRVQLVDVRANRVLATREFDESEAAATDDAYGGVIAANRALERLLGQVAAFVAEHAGGR